MKKTNCRLCKSKDLVMFLDLGHHPHSDNFRKDPDLPETTYPLRLVQCQDCQFVQLDYTVSPDVLYDADYLYESSITKTADKHWTEFVESASRVVPKGKVLDIGSNDGTLLSKFKAKGFEVLGIDPCQQIVDIALGRDIPTICGLFPYPLWKKEEKFDLITGSNVFAHIDDLDAVMEQVDFLLKPNGVFVFESPYLGDFIDKLEYDTVYHQHLSYLAVAPLVKFLESHDMEIFDIEFTPIHGGCFRCYIQRKNGIHWKMDIVDEIAHNEKFSLEKLKDFARKVEDNRVKLLSLVLNFKKQGSRIVGVSAPAKGMTLLNYTGIGKYLDFVTDVSKLKQGRYTPGSHLLIKSDADLKEDDVCVILAWNFQAEIVVNNPKIKTWIVPVPEPHCLI